VTAPQNDPTIIALGAAELRNLRELCPSLLYAALLTDDGFEIAHVPDDYADPNRFASMASSVQALGDAVARELRIGSSPYIVIASEAGHVIQQRVPGHQVVLAALFDNYETLGKALSISRRSAERVAAAFAVATAA
jgi:predicted regulator of Ras-like GTPase activity (Roadblock/LC7/MglB family)